MIYLIRVHPDYRLGVGAAPGACLVMHPLTVALPVSAFVEAKTLPCQALHVVPFQTSVTPTTTLGCAGVAAKHSATCSLATGQIVVMGVSANAAVRPHAACCSTRAFRLAANAWTVTVKTKFVTHKHQTGVA
jgi:hypothetical protein